MKLLRTASILFLLTLMPTHGADILDRQKLLDAQTFWDNRDWDWYKENIPFFECPDADITTTYYYRWELLTKHLTYGSPNTGYVFTEFIDRPFWSGRYGSISCPAGHQLYEARWLNDPQIVRDYSRYWTRTPGAQPRRYSTWLADAIWAAHQVHDDPKITELLADLVKNYEGWEAEHFTADVGLFWQSGHDDGMEYNINSRQSPDILRGAPGFRPTLNAYMWADALAIARIAELAKNGEVAAKFRDKAARIKANLESKLWDPKREFFFHMYMRDETHDGFTVKANTLTHQSGQFAGSPYGRELIGYVPWQFNMVDARYDAAWKKLMDPDAFYADYGPCTVEKRDPMFLLKNTCCWWSGQSWPYASAQTLKAMANLLQREPAGSKAPLSNTDYVKQLTIFAESHRKNGIPYIAEALNPDTGSFEGHDSYNHSEHYFHSSFIDLVITGLAGIIPQDGNSLVVHPLALESWPYFALERISYKGHSFAVIWDKTGERYKLGAGLRVFMDGTQVAQSSKLERLKIDVPPRKPTETQTLVNFAVNNDGTYYPRAIASNTSGGAPLSKLFDGNVWYHQRPPNRWTCEGSPNDVDWVAIDFGAPRRVNKVVLYVLDDVSGREKFKPANDPTDGKSTIQAPQKIDVEIWDGKNWIEAPNAIQRPREIAGHSSLRIRFEPTDTQKVRVMLHHRPGAKSGLSEIEVWGEATLPLEPVPPPKNNLAYNPGDKPFPKASASHTSRWDKPERANDGVVNFNPNPNNRWTAYESPDAEDWFELDFGEKKEFSRVELALYDDRGGVQPPISYSIQIPDGEKWIDIPNQQKNPPQPAGGQFNEVRFPKVQSTKMRVLFVHKQPAKSGMTEIYVWPE